MTRTWIQRSTAVLLLITALGFATPPASAAMRSNSSEGSAVLATPWNGFIALWNTMLANLRHSLTFASRPTVKDGPAVVPPPPPGGVSTDSGSTINPDG